MLVNVKFFKKIFLFSVFLLISSGLSANEKDKIIFQLKDLKSLEFTFNQLINEKVEKGSCLLEYPGKLKCNYSKNRTNLISGVKKIRSQKRDSQN